MKSNFLKKIDRRRLVYSSVFGFIMSIFIVIGKQLNDTGKIKYDFLPLCFIFGMLLTVLLSPVVLYRYMFPIVLSMPIMFYIILKCSEGKKREKTK